MVCLSPLIPLLQQHNRVSSLPLHPAEIVRVPVQSSATGLTAMGEHYFALLVSQEGKQLLQVYDTRYGTLQTSATLPAGSQNQKVSSDTYLLVQ